MEMMTLFSSRTMSFLLLTHIGVGWRVVLKACPSSANLTGAFLLDFEFPEGKKHFFHLCVPIRKSTVPGL